MKPALVTTPAPSVAMSTAGPAVCSSAAVVVVPHRPGALSLSRPTCRSNRSRPDVGVDEWRIMASGQCTQSGEGTGVACCLNPLRRGGVVAGNRHRLRKGISIQQLAQGYAQRQPYRTCATPKVAQA